MPAVVHITCTFCGKQFEPSEDQKYPSSAKHRRCCSSACASRLPRRSIAERLDRKLDKSAGPDGCWFFKGFKDRKGYGLIRSGNKLRFAHRVAWETANGPVQDDLLVCHRCDVPRCCNPSHLFLGTHVDNMRDKSEKGRQAKGEQNGLAKLTESDIRTIRDLHENRGVSAYKIAKAFGMGRSAILSIVNRETWKHV